jgi:ABC-type branched-subunit amino acid transport system substrate-binding protein
MFGYRLDRRKLMAQVVSLTAMALVAGCAVVPKQRPTTERPPERPTSNLPTDSQRHRVALMVPMEGTNGPVGQAIANAATMALLDTNAANIRITTYDTSVGVQAAATRAIADGNQLILGPLLSEDIPVVASAARAARVPVISFSNDEAAAAPGVYVMGNLPGQSIGRTVAYARSVGAVRFAALVPSGTYGQRASAAFTQAVRAAGGTVVATEGFDRGNTSAISAAQRLRAKGGYDAVLIADGGRIAAQAAASLKGKAGTARILGTELWSGEGVVATTPALRGALFSTVSDTRFRQFSDSYKARFGTQPYRIATLGYDAVLLTIRLARDWKPGTNLPTARLTDGSAFLGVDGAFRFRSNGVIERALEVREVRATGVAVVNPAPAGF